MKEPRDVAEQPRTQAGKPAGDPSPFARWAALWLAGAGMAVAGCGGGSPEPTTATPQFFVEGGPGSPTLALIADSTPGAQIYYTTDGTTPTTASTLYTGPVTVLQTETFEAIAVANGYANSAVTNTTYVLLQVQAPVFSVAPGTYTWPQTVAITDSTLDARVYYTTDGSTPTTSSTLYSGPITVSSTETIQAIAVAAGYTNSTVATAGYTINLPQPGAVLTGLVLDGQQPIVGAHVYLFAANTTGYGQASVSLLSATETGNADAVGGYVTTGSNGGFSMTGEFACTSGLQQVYVLALGGNANPAAGLMAAIGTCPSGTGPAVFATVNEVTTIAVAYALAGFATDATHVSSSGTALAQVGLTNAFANAGNLVDGAAGAARATTPAGDGTVPQAEINTLANILATCVGSTGATSAACSTLLGDALSGGTSGTSPTETATVAINIAHHPGANTAALYALASGPPQFTPGLSVQPSSFSIWLNYAGVTNSPHAVAIDGAGNAWIADEGGNDVVKLSSLGVVLSGANGYSGRGLRQPYGIAVDGSGNAWVTDSVHGVTMLSSSGTTGFAGIVYPPNSVLNGPTGIAIDAAGNAWIANYSGNSISVVSNSDTLVSTFTGSGITTPEAVAIDGGGNAWVANGGGGSISSISSAGVVSQYAGGGLSVSDGIAVDHSGDAWVSNEVGNGVTEVSNAGVFLSGAGGYAGSGSGGLSIAIDGAGNVWSESTSGLTELSNAGSVLLEIPGPGRNGVAIDGSGSVWLVGAGVTQMIGAATPVVTPLAVGVKNNTLGTRP